MLHVGLDLSRARLDVHVMDDTGPPIAVTTAAPDAGGLASLAYRLGECGQPVTAVIESMTGARFVHDQLELARLVGGDRRRGEGEGLPAAGLQDRQDRRVGAGRAVPPGSGAGDLAADAGGARRAGAGPLAAAPGGSRHRVEQPDPRHADGLRPSVPGVGSVRRRRSSTTRSPRAARAVGRRRGRRVAADRGSWTGRSTPARPRCARPAPSTGMCRR
jgi:hypothetical protein